MTPEPRIRTSLSRVLPQAPTPPEKLRTWAAEAWRKGGVVVLFPDQTLNWEERALIESAAIKLYGKRG
jgi:hypothetical protein